MAVTTANSKHYDSMSKKVGKDGYGSPDPVQDAAMPKGTKSGRSGGKADRNMTPAPTVKAEKYGKGR